MRSVRCFDWFILLWCHWTNLGLLPKWQLWATFFISIIKIISIIGLFCIMIQVKCYFWTCGCRKNGQYQSNICLGQIKTIHFWSYIYPLPRWKKFFRLSVRPSVRRAVHSSLALANRYINNCFSYSGHICIWHISRWNSNMGDLDLFLQILQIIGHACLISNLYIKAIVKNRSGYSVPICTTGVSCEYHGQVEI